MLLILVLTSVFAAEYQYGQGTLSFKGGIFGVDKTLSTDIKIYGFLNEHKNIFGTNYFFAYKLAIYKSQDVKNAIETYNSTIGMTSQTSNLSFRYKVKGIDFNFVLGRDFYREGSDYLGVGVLIGITGPYIKSRSDSNNSASSIPGYEYLNDSETKMLTYKIGPSLRVQKELLSFFTVYGDAQYGFQKAHIKNDSAHLDQYDSGNYTSYNVGIRFQAKSGRKKIWIISFSPKFFVTFGYRYSYWKVKNVKLNDISLIGPADISFTVKYAYFGLGYDF